MRTLINLRGAALLLTALLATAIGLRAQNAPTLEDLIPGGTSYRSAETLYGLQWWGDACITPTVDTLYATNPRTGAKRLLVTRETVNGALEQAGLEKLTRLYNVRTPWAERTQMLIELPDKYVVYDWTSNSVVGKQGFPRRAANRDYNAASGNVAYTVGNNLYV
ncbi:MAG: S9 family peptidase, partial [Prevotellaceae bacterium]|nr:S9 family peptidase [Prevotellaceae bacterium]